MTKWIELSPVGSPAGTGAREGRGWSGLALEEPWSTVVEALVPGGSPTDAQVKAIRDGKLLTSRRNLIVASPTNSGKSLIGYLALLRGVLQGKRVLLLEPLRALAQEKHDELRSVAGMLGPVIGKEPEVIITTGDYRLDEERIASPPPESGQVVIATPERIEAILRNTAFDLWIESIGVVVVDEAHLLGDPRRGAALEYVLTSMKLLKAPPRMLLLSATLGVPGTLQAWLDPCDFVGSDVRHPPLERRIRVVSDGEEPNEVVEEVVRDALAEPDRNVLIFVYQTQWAEKLARDLCLGEGLRDTLGADGALAYHSRMSAATREDVRQRFGTGGSRCVVTTAALAMGVNLPATDVIVRDLDYGPGNPLEIDRLLQMAGRAGRGDRSGRATFVVKGGDAAAERLRRKLEAGELPAIRSALVPVGDHGNGWRSQGGEQDEAFAEVILSLLARAGEDGMSLDGLRVFLDATLEGAALSSRIDGPLGWLSASGRSLAWKDEDRGIWRTTVLGEASIRSSLPLPAASGIAQLVRDILSIDPDDGILRGWTSMDLLLLVELVALTPWLRVRFTEELAGRIDDWMTSSVEAPVLFRKWIRGKPGFSKAEEIAGSLGLEPGGGKGRGADKARQHAYLASLRTIILWQRANGVSADDVARRWKIPDLSEVEERWRDDRLFLLGALRGMWDIRCFYHHLKESCEASKERVQAVKRNLQRLAGLNARLLNLVSWCSPLGTLFLRLRSTMRATGKPLPGLETMTRLQEGGIVAAADLKGKSVKDLQQLGLRKDLASVIVGYVRR